MKVEYGKYEEQHFVCPKCGWHGKGDQLLNGEFSEMHFICDLECPKCYEMIAYWQAPLSSQ